MRRTGEMPAATGGSSLLVIFAVLCLTVFALLSLATVQADSRLSDAAAGAAAAYYEADARAEELYARLRAGQRPAGVTERDGIYTYTCAISETQTLCVSLRERGGEWTVLRWQAVARDEAGTDAPINVWNGE